MKRKFTKYPKDVTSACGKKKVAVSASVNAGEGDSLASAIEQTLARNGVEFSEVICFDDDPEYGIDISVETTPNDDEYYVASVLEDAYPDAHVEVSDTRACTIHLHWDV